MCFCTEVRLPVATQGVACLCSFLYSLLLTPAPLLVSTIGNLLLGFNQYAGQILLSFLVETDRRSLHMVDHFCVSSCTLPSPVLHGLPDLTIREPTIP